MPFQNHFYCCLLVVSADLEARTSVDVTNGCLQVTPNHSNRPRYDRKTYKRRNENDNSSWFDWRLFSDRCYSYLCCACCDWSQGICTLTLSYLNSWWFAASDHSASSWDPYYYGDVAMSDIMESGQRVDLQNWLSPESRDPLIMPHPIRNWLYEPHWRAMTSILGPDLRRWLRTFLTTAI